MKRRDSKTLTFSDMAQYADMREAVCESQRLMRLTDNALVQNHLQAYAMKLWEDFCKWLDEEVE